MKALHTRRGGFTLIELMIVVAIIGILAAIAIPNFIRFQLRAKASEGKTNLKAIVVAQEGYAAEFSTYVSATEQPTAVLGSDKQQWPITDCAVAPWDTHGFCISGWAPEGEVFYHYAVAGNDVDGDGTLDVFTADAISDIDADGSTNAWGYVKGQDPSGTNAIAGPLGCPATGTFNPVTNTTDMFEVVGPCDGVSGRSVF
jgi:type IV pilus assembly protein PilA